MSGLEKLFEEHNTILRQIAESLDVLAMGQDTQIQTLDELVNIAEEVADALAPVTTGEPVIMSIIPGFPADPLEGFPTVRKEQDNGTSN